MQHYTYRTHRICSSQIDYDLEDGVIHNLKFAGGCPGNLKAIGMLVEGRKAEEVIPLLENVDCGGKGTSCPAQFAASLKEAIGAK